MGSQDAEGPFADLLALGLPEVSGGVRALAKVDRFRTDAPVGCEAGYLADHRAAVLSTLGHQIVGTLEALERLAVSPSLHDRFRSEAWGALRVVIETCGRPRVPLPRERARVAAPVPVVGPVSILPLEVPERVGASAGRLGCTCDLPEEVSRRSGHLRLCPLFRPRPSGVEAGGER